MLELNKIYNTDCAEGLKFLDDASIDLVLTSPPYDNLRKYNGFKFEFEKIAAEIYRVMKEGGVVVWIVNDATIDGSETGTSFKQALFFKNIGFNLHDTMIYQKCGCLFPEQNRYYPNFEYMFVFSKGKPRTVNLIADRKNKCAGDTVTGTWRGADGILKSKAAVKNKTGRKISEYGVRYNIWKYPGGSGKSSKNRNVFKHPAVFPEQLARDHIISWSNEGDLVLDPFIGSGTTAKVAIETKRNFIGFEISREYCEIAKKRLEEDLNVRTD